MLNACPDCDKTLAPMATECGCGWKQATKPAGPDHARIEADRQRMIAGAHRRHSGPRACQERRCIRHAVPGGDLCAVHAAMPPDQVRRYVKPRRVRVADPLEELPLPVVTRPDAIPNVENPPEEFI